MTHRRPQLHGTKNRWYIDETANVSWPGALPWRGLRSAQKGAGYATEEEAYHRAGAINAHYNATKGQGLPLVVRYAGPKS